jgi:multiple sugar transport system substrate-binding protein
MKKLVSLVLAVAMFLSLVSVAAAEDVTIPYACFSAAGIQQDTLKKMVEVFETKNPGIKVDVQLTGYNDYFTSLATKVGGGNAPDVFEMNMENFLAYMLRGQCLDLTDMGIAKDNYSAGTLSAVSSNGKLYAVPESFSTCLMFYNKALFDQAGVAYPTNDWTWADAQAAAEKIRALGDDTWGYYQPVTYNELYKSIAGNGGSLLNADYTAFTPTRPRTWRCWTR